MVQRDIHYIGRDRRKGGPEDFTKPPTWRRTEACLASELAHAAKEGKEP